MGNRQLRFMSIGGNCADIGYLGEHRIRGPVDNVNSIYGLRSSELLFKEKLYNEIFETEPIIKPRIPGFETDSKLSFFYKMHEICHNDPRTPEYKQEFMKRLKNFKNFYKAILGGSKTHFFTYSLDWNETTKGKGIVKQNFYDGVEMLKKYKVFNQTVFVGTRNKTISSHWNFHFDSLPKIKGLKYIEISDLDIFAKDKEKYYIYFLEQLIPLIVK